MSPILPRNPTGTKRNFTFDHFLEKLRRCYMDMGTPQPPDDEKIDHFLKAVRGCKMLENIDSNIAVAPHINGNFEEVIRLCQDQITRRSSTKPGSSTNRNISQFQQGNQNPNKGGRKRKGNGGGQPNPKKGKGKGKAKTEGQEPTKFDPNNPGQWLPKSVWAKLTPEQRQQANEARPPRENRGISAVEVQGMMQQLQEGIRNDLRAAQACNQQQNPNQWDGRAPPGNQRGANRSNNNDNGSNSTGIDFPPPLGHGGGRG